MQTSPEPCSMRQSPHRALHKPRRVSSKSFSETSPEKTRWPHKLPWKSRDPCAVISSLKVTSDSLLWLAALLKPDARSAAALILFSCCFSLLLLPFPSSRSLNASFTGLYQVHSPHSPLPLHLHSYPTTFSTCPYFPRGIFAPHR